MSPDFSLAEERCLLALYFAGVPVFVISKGLKKPPAVIYHRLRRLELPLSQSPRELRAIKLMFENPEYSEWEKNMNRGPWSFMDERGMSADYTAMMSTRDLAQKYDRSEGAIRDKIYVMGLKRARVFHQRLPPYEWTDERTESLIKMWGELDKTQNEMTLILGCSHHALREKALEVELPKRRTKRTDISARHAAKITITPWPEDMPKFQDHPDTINGNDGRRYNSLEVPKTKTSNSSLADW